MDVVRKKLINKGKIGSISVSDFGQNVQMDQKTRLCVCVFLCLCVSVFV